MEYNFDQLVESFEFLDDLRESGVTNMFGASVHLQNDLGYDKNTARNIASAWMGTYDGVSSAKDRVIQACT